MAELGAFTLVIALGAAVIGLFETRKRRSRAQTETLACSDLTRREGEAGGPGSFKTVCEVTGRAAPGPDGALAAPFSKGDCVWHRSVVTHHYWETKRDRDGDRRRAELQEVVSEQQSQDPFLIDDGTGTILVEPSAERPEGAPKVHRHFEKDEEAAAKGYPALASLGNLVTQVAGASVVFGKSGGTLGYEFEEWVVRSGDRLYVLGEATNEGGRLVMRAAADGDFVISLSSEEELARESLSTERLLYGGSAVLAALGAGLLTAGLLT